MKHQQAHEAESSEAPDLRILADDMVQAVGLASAPVAVFLLAPDADMAPFAGWAPVERHRYCQALMKARRGERVILEADELACPAAAKAFGFKPLPEGLQTGKGLVGFGIVAEPESGARMFAGMACLEPGTVRASPCARWLRRRRCRTSWWSKDRRSSSCGCCSPR